MVRLALQFPLTLVELLELLPHPAIASTNVRRAIIPIDLRTSPPETKSTQPREPKIVVKVV